ncbi:hypothetical protein B296_00007305 [Ensete ventricosum]|uniref:Uncharacterized protein n=1 Tax=Ensete ventricosum TaxID=4639 RepID=A0A427B7K1_ENSVE|nr:hypothetical protein B296_00007305 [Ensete ventricosum]
MVSVVEDHGEEVVISSLEGDIVSRFYSSVMFGKDKGGKCLRPSTKNAVNKLNLRLVVRGRRERSSGCGIRLAMKVLPIASFAVRRSSLARAAKNGQF